MEKLDDDDPIPTLKFSPREFWEKARSAFPRAWLRCAAAFARAHRGAHTRLAQNPGAEVLRAAWQAGKPELASRPLQRPNFVPIVSSVMLAQAPRAATAATHTMAPRRVPVREACGWTRCAIPSHRRC